MKDHEMEQQLKGLPTPELPESWRTEILTTALRQAHASTPHRPTWPAVFIYLRHLFARNPITTSALTALWLLIFLFKATNPVDPAEKDFLAHDDPNRPVYLVSLQDQILLAQLLQDQPNQSPAQLIP